jgi:hypothetical protein
MTDTAARMRQLIGNTAAWAANNIVLGNGEIGIEVVSSSDVRMKVGNGSSTWSALPYASASSTAINSATQAALDAKIALAGGTMTGLLVLSGNPSSALGAATKQYVDAINSSLSSSINGKFSNSGGTITGPLTLPAAPSSALHAATKAYVDSGDTAKLNKSGDTMSGGLILAGDPTAALEAATKQYVDGGPYQTTVGGSAIYANKVVKLNSSGILDSSLLPISATYLGSVNLTVSYGLTGTYTPGNYYAVSATGTVDASWNTKLNGAPTTCGAGQFIIYSINGKWDLVGDTTSSAAITGKLDKSGGTMTGALTLAGAPTSALQAATKLYVDTATTGVALTANNLSDLANKSTARDNLQLGASNSPQFASIELGAATDTTITRSAAGVIAVEGGIIPKENRANTFTANQVINANVGIGASVSTTANLYVTKPKTGGTVIFGVYDSGLVQSDVTSQAWYYNTEAGTAAAAFTLNTLGHYRANQQALGAGSSVTNQFGFFATGNLIEATNNYAFAANNTAAVTAGKTAYGFHSAVNIATGGGTTYGFYSAGTAPNFFNGSVGIGTSSPSSYGKLAVIGGSIYTDNALYSSDGTTTSRVISSGAVSYWGTTTSHPVVVQTNNTERMRVVTGGNVGIGTTDPQAKLSVSNAGAATFEFFTNYPGGGTGTYIQSFHRSGSAYVNTAYDALTHSFRTSGTERAVINSSGMTIGGSPVIAASGTAAQGDILYHNGTAWTRLAAGTSGQYLKTNGAGANPAWADASGGSVLLGTLNTTSGSTATLSGLNLTNYRQLYITFSGVSGTSVSARTLTINGVICSPSGDTAATTYSGWMTVDLIIGNGFLLSQSSTSATSVGILQGETGYNQSSTSIQFGWSATNTFDAGVIKFYGVR